MRADRLRSDDGLTALSQTSVVTCRDHGIGREPVDSSAIHAQSKGGMALNADGLHPER